MFHLGHVDTVIVSVRADPLDPHDALLEIHRHDEPVTVAFDVEHDAFGSHDTRGGIETPDIGRASPACLADLVEPSVKRGFERRLIFVPGARGDEFSQRPPGNNSHAETVSCAQMGHKVASAARVPPHWRRRRAVRYRVFPADFLTRAGRRLRHLQAKTGAQALHRSLPRDPESARAPLRQLQHRARAARRRSGSAAGGTGLCAARARRRRSAGRMPGGYFCGHGRWGVRGDMRGGESGAPAASGGRTMRLEGPLTPPLSPRRAGRGSRPSLSLDLMAMAFDDSSPRHWLRWPGRFLTVMAQARLPTSLPLVSSSSI